MWRLLNRFQEAFEEWKTWRRWKRAHLQSKTRRCMVRLPKVFPALARIEEPIYFVAWAGGFFGGNVGTSHSTNSCSRSSRCFVAFFTSSVFGKYSARVSLHTV